MNYEREKQRSGRFFFFLPIFPPSYSLLGIFINIADLPTLLKSTCHQKFSFFFFFFLIFYFVGILLEQESDRDHVTRTGPTNEDEMCNFYIMYHVDGESVPLPKRTANCRSSREVRWSAAYGEDNVPDGASEFGGRRYLPKEG